MRLLRGWVPVAVWAAAIWVFSTGEFSAASTSRFVMPLLHWLLPRASPETLQQLHFLVRKSAHVMEYFILGVLLLRAIRRDRGGWQWRWAFTAVLLSACYAALDEFHQSFVTSRTASPYDSLLDTTGAALAQVLPWLLSQWKLPRTSRPT